MSWTFILFFSPEFLFFFDSPLLKPLKIPQLLNSPLGTTCWWMSNCWIPAATQSEIVFFFFPVEKRILSRRMFFELEFVFFFFQWLTKRNDGQNVSINFDNNQAKAMLVANLSTYRWPSFIHEFVSLYCVHLVASVSYTVAAVLPTEYSFFRDSLHCAYSCTPGVPPYFYRLWLFLTSLASPFNARDFTGLIILSWTNWRGSDSHFAGRKCQDQGDGGNYFWQR